MADSFRFNLLNTIRWSAVLILSGILPDLWRGHVHLEDLRFTIAMAIIALPIIWFGSHEYWDWKHGGRVTKND